MICIHQFRQFIKFLLLFYNGIWDKTQHRLCTLAEKPLLCLDIIVYPVLYCSLTYCKVLFKINTTLAIHPCVRHKGHCLYRVNEYSWHLIFAFTLCYIDWLVENSLPLTLLLNACAYNHQNWYLDSRCVKAASYWF